MIECDYSPSESSFKIIKNGKIWQLDVTPCGNVYRPCVYLTSIGDTVEIINPL